MKSDTFNKKKIRHIIYNFINNNLSMIIFLTHRIVAPVKSGATASVNFELSRFLGISLNLGLIAGKRSLLKTRRIHILNIDLKDIIICIINQIEFSLTLSSLRAKRVLQTLFSELHHCQ